MGKEHNAVEGRKKRKRGLALPLVCCSVVNHYTRAHEVEEMGVWEQRQPPGNIPPFPSLSMS